ncbi:flavin reductase family protein [Microbacterium sp. 18062]|uniref:flavin reductase family protein n=1 Tax=Microbacterium sp. 18062 TaxID=2681410 RepID=UPI001358D78D|nr:flavin reductase family protein [Microbacterium sp. 18062]
MTEETMTTQSDLQARSAATAQWWRAVLGQYPTGVVLVSSLDEDGERLGMVVGSFAAVSKDPPLVSIMPARDSSTYPRIQAQGRFAVSVLGSRHEELCRAFSRKTPDRWDTAHWEDTPGGLPRLADAVSWFECRVRNTHEAGDHSIVLAEVTEFGAGVPGAGLPLIYFRGGYGSFTVSSLDYDVAGLSRQLAQVDAIRAEVRAFAERWNAECVVYGRAADLVLVLHAANLRSHLAPAARPVGATFSFAAPLAAAFAAWGDEDTVHTWTENARHLVGGLDRGVIDELLQSTRARGFGVWLNSSALEAFQRISTEGPAGPDDIDRFWCGVADEVRAAAAGWEQELTAASSVQIPIVGADGRAEVIVSVSHLGELIAAQQTSGDEGALQAFAADLVRLSGRGTP